MSANPLLSTTLDPYRAIAGLAIRTTLEDGLGAKGLDIVRIGMGGVASGGYHHPTPVLSPRSTDFNPEGGLGNSSTVSDRVSAATDRICEEYRSKTDFEVGVGGKDIRFMEVITIPVVVASIETIGQDGTTTTETEVEYSIRGPRFNQGYERRGIPGSRPQWGKRPDPACGVGNQG